MDQEFSRRIRADLVMAGVHMTDIARVMGVTPQHVREVAVNDRRSARVRKAIAEAIGRDPWQEVDARAN